VLSILITHIKLYTLSVFDPCYMCSMCIRCCWSLLHTFYMHPVLSILATCILCALGVLIHFPCVPSAFNPCCVCSMHIRCCQSLLRTFGGHVFSIFFTHFPCTFGAFVPLPKHLVFLILFTCSLFMLGALNPLYKCLVLFFFLSILSCLVFS